MDKVKLIILKHKSVIIIFIFYCFFNLMGIGCIFKWLFGISCPACGMTRAVISFLELDIKAALYYHPLFWLIIPSTLFIIHAQKPLFKNEFKQNVFLLVLLFIILTVYFLRLFILKNEVVTIDITSGKVILLLKAICEVFL